MCNVADIFSGAYASNVECIHASGHGHIFHGIEFIYWHSCLISVYKLVGMYGIYVAFDGHICCHVYGHIYGHRMMDKVAVHCIWHKGLIFSLIEQYFSSTQAFNWSLPRLHQVCRKMSLLILISNVVENVYLYNL